MIETGFRMVENERVRTRSRSVVRTLCFLYSLVLFNLANAELTSSPRWASTPARRPT